ncbi:MAG: hypothetical protein P8O79_13640, partial [Halieaceae bacterium]|nr:hypothetical protein [Halieaceae bacterium]
MIVVNGEIISNREPMFFFNINRCNYFAAQIVSGKREARGVQHNITKVAAYCVPKLVDPGKIKVYS